MCRRVNFHTLGCKLNFAESSAISRQFEQGGFIRVGATEKADICIINSCSVTEHADKKCRNIIRHLHRLNPNAIIAVTGCYAQLKPQEIGDIEGVDLVLSNNDKGQMYEKVTQLATKGKAQIYSCQTDEIRSFFSAFSTAERTRAFLKVQDGCDYCCTYCTIHNARGGSRNIPIADIVKQAEAIAANGQKEIVITGVNTGDFGRTTGESFADLLRALDRVEGIERYRISSIEPNLITDEIIDICANSKKFCHHFHIPIQCGSNKILALMHRRYTIEKFADRIAKIRSVMPDAFLGIDVITGFPGEGEQEFEDSYNFLESLAPSFLHIFPFSERPNTPAINYPNKVQSSISTNRVKRYEQLSNQLHINFCNKFIGTTKKVLFESTIRGGQMFGYTDNYIKVQVPYQKELINKIVDVTLTKIIDETTVLGTIIKE